jgi:hypothetical protein
MEIASVNFIMILEQNQLGTDHLIFHGGGGGGGGRKSEKKYRACLEWKKNKSNITKGGFPVLAWSSSQLAASVCI